MDFTLRVGILRRSISSWERPEHAVKAPVLLDHDDDMFDGIAGAWSSLKRARRGCWNKAHHNKQNDKGIRNIRLLESLEPLMEEIRLVLLIIHLPDLSKL